MVSKTVNEFMYLFISEFVATAIFIFVGCSSYVIGPIRPYSDFVIELIFGLIIMLDLNTFGHLSGSYLNPIIGITAAILRMITPQKAILYSVAEILGSIAGFYLLRLVTPKVHQPGLCTINPHPDITPFMAVFVELIYTSILIVYLCSVWDVNNIDLIIFAPFRIGIIVTCLALAAGPYSGGCLNPARVIGPALYNRDWENHWVYWVGPLLASIVSPYLYKCLFVNAKFPVAPEYKSAVQTLNDENKSQTEQV